MNSQDIWTSTSGSPDAFGGERNPSAIDLTYAFLGTARAVVDIIANKTAEIMTEKLQLVYTGKKSLKTKPFSQKSIQHFSKSLKKSIDPKEVVDHPCLDVLFNPNKVMSFFDMIKLTVTSLKFIGNSYWVKLDHKLDIPQSLFWLPAHMVTMEKDDKGFVKKYKTGTGKTLKEYEPEQIIHFRDTSLIDPYCNATNVSSIQSVWLELQTMFKELSSWDSLVTNMAWPTCVISPKDTDLGWSSTDAEAMGKKMEQRFRGQNRGGALFPTSPIDFNVLNWPAKDLAGLQLNADLKKAICNSQGMPTNFMDMLETSRASADTSERSLQKNAIHPIIVNVCDTLTRSYLCDFQKQEQKTLFFSVDSFETEDADFNQKQQSLDLQSVSSGVMTINEYRIKYDLEAVVGGNKLLPPSNTFAQSSTGASFGDKKSLIIKNETGIAGIVEILKRFADEQLEAVLSGMKSVKIRTKAIPNETFFKLSQYNEPMVLELMPIFQSFYDEASKSLVARLGFSDKVPRVSQQDLQPALEQAVMDFCKSTNDTTTLALDDALEQTRLELLQGITSGEAAAVLKDRVQGVFEELSDTRAYRIAVTEQSRAQHTAELITIQKSGLDIKKKWLASDNACPECAKVNGEVRSPDEAFATKGTGPYSVISSPPAHPHCLLAETPVFAPGAVSSFVANYSGPILRVVLSSGDSFSCTPNHHLLTPSGFVKASELMNRDEIIYCPLTEGITFGVPDNKWKPTAIEKIVRSLAKNQGMFSSSVPVSPEYLNGDATFCEGDIDIVRTTSLLNNEGSGEFRNKPFFQRADSRMILPTNSSITERLEGFFGTKYSSMGGLSYLHSVLDGGMLEPDKSSFTGSSGSNSSRNKTTANNTSTNSEHERQGQFALSRQVTVCNVLNIEWDIFHGKVFDLETKTGLYLIGSGIVSHNCTCSLEYIVKD